MDAIKAERTTREGPAYSTYANFGHGANVTEKDHPLRRACQGKESEGSKEAEAPEINDWRPTDMGEEEGGSPREAAKRRTLVSSNGKQ